MLGWVDPGAGKQLVDVATGERPIAGKAANGEVHIATSLVCVPLGDELLDQLDHLGDVFGGAGLDVRSTDAKPAVGVCKDSGVAGGKLCWGNTLGGGAGDDLVLDVCDVLDIRDLVAPPGEVTSDHVEGDRRPAVPDMGTRLHGRPADVHAHLARLARFERLETTPEGVEDVHGRDATGARADGW